MPSARTQRRSRSVARGVVHVEHLDGYSVASRACPSTARACRARCRTRDPSARARSAARSCGRRRRRGSTGALPTRRRRRPGPVRRRPPTSSDHRGRSGRAELRCSRLRRRRSASRTARRRRRTRCGSRSDRARRRTGTPASRSAARMVRIGDSSGQVSSSIDVLVPSATVAPPIAMVSKPSGWAPVGPATACCARSQGVVVGDFPHQHLALRGTGDDQPSVGGDRGGGRGVARGVQVADRPATVALRRERPATTASPLTARAFTPSA